MRDSIVRIHELESTFSIRTTRDRDDTLDLRYGVYYRGQAEPSQFIVMLNGRTEWIEKYCYVPHDLHLPPRTGVLTWDHRGQGASGGARSYVDDYSTYCRDGAKIIEEVVGHRPYVMMCHSMGGLIGLYGTLHGIFNPCSLVLCSPLLGLPDQPLPRELAKPLASVAKKLKLGATGTGAGALGPLPFESNKLTHSYPHYSRIQNNPFRLPSATFGWVDATFRALDQVFDPKLLEGLRAPVLVMAGSEESVVDPHAFQKWVQLAARHSKSAIQYRLFHGARHELLSETRAVYEQALHAFEKWVSPCLHF